MKFFDNTKIANWQSLERTKLDLSIEKARGGKSLSSIDMRRIRRNRRTELMAVNSYAKLEWNKAICTQVAGFFCEGGEGGDGADGNYHNQEMFFVTFCDLRCVRSSNDRLSDQELDRIKARLRYALRGHSYLGVIEPAYYANFQAGIRYGADRRCVSWHLHALVWGISKENLRNHLRKLTKQGRYVQLAKGLKPTQVKRIEQGNLPRTVGYLLKSPISAYRVSKIDCVDRYGRPIIDDDGVIQRKFKQGKSALRHGERLTLFHLMKHLSLYSLTLAGGQGCSLLIAAKRSSLSEPSCVRSAAGRRSRSRRPTRKSRRPISKSAAR